MIMKGFKMSEVKHDYLGALRVLEDYIKANTKNSSLLSHVEITNAKKVIEHALKLSAVVTGEPTERMRKAGILAAASDEGEAASVLDKDGNEVALIQYTGISEFKAMIAQAEKEIG